MDYRTLTRLLERGNGEGCLDACLVITINDISSDAVPILPVSMLSERKGMALLRRQLGGHLDGEAADAIVRELGTLFSAEGMASSLRFLDPHKIVADVASCTEGYEACWDTIFPTSLRMNLSLHLSLMVERLMLHDGGGLCRAGEAEIMAPQKFMSQTADILSPLADKYHITIPREEIEMLYEILKFVLT